MNMIDGKLHRYAYLLVYGCQMNQSDAERMMGQLRTIGYERTESMEEADLILINTCCVRETAEDRVYGKIGEIKRLKRERPELIFGITGCMAQKEGDALIKRAPHINFVLGTNKVHELTRVVQEIQAERGHVVDVQLGETELPDDVPVARAGSLSAWVPIMYGCNNFCTYCIVPYVRGRERSRLPEDIVREVEEAVKNGYEEVTLLGQNVNSYGKDHKLADFADLLKMVDEVPGIRRVRFMTSHPKDLSDKVIAAIRDGEHLCEHIHLPVQYGSNRILKAMNRVYTVESYRDLVRRIRAAIPEVSLTTDLIVGFPGETDAQYQTLRNFLEEMRLDKVGVFTYSREEGTPAYDMPNQVPEEIMQERYHDLMSLQCKISEEINQSLEGKELDVLIEGRDEEQPNISVGRSYREAPEVDGQVYVENDADSKPGDIVRVRVLQGFTYDVVGERIDGAEKGKKAAE